MADRHRRVLGEQQHRHRLADDLAPPDDDGFLALQLDPVLGEHGHDPERRRGHEEGLAEVETSCVQDVEAIDVLGRIHGAEDSRFVHVPGKRELNEDPVDRIVGVELGDEVEDVALGRVGREAVVARVDPRLVRCLVLAPDVDVGGRIVAHENRREAHGLPERAHVLRDLGANLQRQRLPVDPDSRHLANTLLRAIEWSGNSGHSVLYQVDDREREGET